MGVWFIATGWAFNYLSLFIGIPADLGLFLAAGVSAFVGFDPLHLMWPVREKVPATRTVLADSSHAITSNL